MSYTPHTSSNGNDFAVTNANGIADVQDMIEAGVTYAGSFGAMDVKASVVGDVGRAQSGNGDTKGIQPGVVLSFGKLSVAGAYGWDETQRRQALVLQRRRRRTRSGRWPSRSTGAR